MPKRQEEKEAPTPCQVMGQEIQHLLQPYAAVPKKAQTNKQKQTKNPKQTNKKPHRESIPPCQNCQTLKTTPLECQRVTLAGLWQCDLSNLPDLSIPTLSPPLLMPQRLYPLGLLNGVTAAGCGCPSVMSGAGMAMTSVSCTASLPTHLSL